jgi:VIT1/CCC1 family predicted Fe2+/Mn2+ transporter
MASFRPRVLLLVSRLRIPHLAMAAGEYVSVSSQADTENADLELEKRSLTENREFEKNELATVYEKRGVDPTLAKEVALQLMAKDALGAHARDELAFMRMLGLDRCKQPSLRRALSP